MELIKNRRSRYTSVVYQSERVLVKWRRSCSCLCVSYPFDEAIVVFLFMCLRRLHDHVRWHHLSNKQRKWRKMPCSSTFSPSISIAYLLQASNHHLSIIPCSLSYLDLSRFDWRLSHSRWWPTKASIAGEGLGLLGRG